MFIVNNVQMEKKETAATKLENKEIIWMLKSE